MHPALRAVPLVAHLRDERARAVLAALVSRGRPPAAADRIERRRAEILQSDEPFESAHLTVGEHARKSSKSPQAAAFLHRLVQRTAPQHAVEMGSAVGISGAYIATALPPGGRLVTLDMAPAAIRATRETFAAVGVDDRAEAVEGSFDVTLEPTLQRMAPVDFLFIDGHHEEGPTVDYLDLALPHLADDAIVVFDDINWSDGMERAWQTVQGRNPAFAVAIGSVGLWAR